MSAGDEDLKRLDKVLAVLGEHYDSVHIFVTRHETSEGGTVNVNRGSGNWFARLGQIQTWVVSQEEQTRINVRESNKE